MSGDLTLALKIQADVGEAVSHLDKVAAGIAKVGESGAKIATASQASDDLARASASAAQSTARLATAANDATMHSQNAAGSLAALCGQSDASTTAVGGLVRQLGALAAGYAGLSGVSSLINMADSYGQMADRIKMATSSTVEYEDVQARLLETAKNTYRPLAEAQELYLRTASSLKNLAYTTTGVLDITDSFSYLLVTNAASSERAASAIDAYSKSIATGKVFAINWQTMLQAMPTLVDRIAEATGKSADAIRALGASGELALEDLRNLCKSTFNQQGFND